MIIVTRAIEATQPVNSDDFRSGRVYQELTQSGDILLVLRKEDDDNVLVGVWLTSIDEHRTPFPVTYIDQTRKFREVDLTIEAKFRG